MSSEDRGWKACMGLNLNFQHNGLKSSAKKALNKKEQEIRGASPSLAQCYSRGWCLQNRNAPRPLFSLRGEASGCILSNSSCLSLGEMEIGRIFV